MACGVFGFSENAHVLGSGGTGRKADATSIAPLCGPHPDERGVLVVGCHKLYDEHRDVFHRLYPKFIAAAAAALTERAWQRRTREGMAPYRVGRQTDHG